MLNILESLFRLYKYNVPMSTVMCNIGRSNRFLSGSYMHIAVNRIINIFQIAGQKAVAQRIDTVNSMSTKVMDNDLIDSILASCLSSNILSKPERRLESNNNNRSVTIVNEC
jgi:hypothetical protein